MDATVKVPWPHIGDSSFAAFQWDIHLFGTYEAIFKSLKVKYPSLTFKYGSKVLPPEEKSLGIAEFINRNKQMYDIFVEGIESSAIFIADITGHNPNVMLELGIAMKLNKNILILKAKDSKEEFPFNIQSVQIQEYTSVAELEKIIFDFIEMFSKIRNQTFDEPLQERYTKIDEVILEGTNFYTHPKFPKKVKNLMIRFNYSFLDHVSKNDWIGIHLRTQGPDRNNSELIFSRVNGKLESLSWPAHKPPKEGLSLATSTVDFLEVSIIEDNLEARTNTKKLSDDNVFADGFGDIMIGIQDHTPQPELVGHKLEVKFTNIEIINLDTTAPIT